MKELLPLLADTTNLENKQKAAQDICDTITGRMRRHMEENARQVQDQAEYERHSQEMRDEYKNAEKQVEQLQDEILEQKARKEKIRRFLDHLRQGENIVTDFDEDLWNATVESVRVHADKSLIFVFRDGTKIPVLLPENKK